MTEAARAPFPVREPPRLLLTGAALVVVIVVLLLLDDVEFVRSRVLAVDEWAHDLAVRWETPVGLWVSRALAVLGGAAVTTPLRIVVGFVFLVQRRWWHLAAWVLSIALMEVAVTAMKVGIDRPRPPQSLEVTRLAAFPSGHAGATAVTVVTLVLLLVASGPPRRRWWAAGGALMIVMSLSRLYLRVHWVSDVAMGALVGIVASLLAVGAVTWFAGRRARPRGVRLRD